MKHDKLITTATLAATSSLSPAKVISKRRETRSKAGHAFLALALSAAISLLSAASARAETTTTRFKGDAADAAFSSTVNDCLVVSANVYAFDNQYKPAEVHGPGQSWSEVWVFVEQFDSCTFEVTMSAGAIAPLADDAFVVDRKLKSATLNATVELFDQLTGTSFLVDVHVDWEGIGDVSQTRLHNVGRSPGFLGMLRVQGRVRRADAYGTVFDGVTDYAPEPAHFSNIGVESRGDLVVIH